MRLPHHNQKLNAGSDVLIMESDVDSFRSKNKWRVQAFHSKTCVSGFYFYWQEIGTHAWKWWIGLAKDGNILKSYSSAFFFFLLWKTQAWFFFLFSIIYTHTNIAQFPPLHPHQRVHFPFPKPHGFILQFCKTQLHCSGAILFGGFNVYSARFKHECLYISV